MSVNLNNYEEYFLLYADNELSLRERNEVEVFVKQHTEFEEEFNMIQRTINFADKNVSLADKSFLIRNESSNFINESTYEEVFVLYHDDELSQEQRNKTEEFVNLHPELKDEFELFGNAKLLPEEFVVFPDKELLCRKEKAGKAITLILWRSIAAAVFIGIGLWTAFSYLNQKEGMRAITFKETIKLPVPASEQNIVSQIPVGAKNSTSSLRKTKVVEEKSHNKNSEKIQSQAIPVKNENKNALVKSEVKNKKLPEVKAIETKNTNNHEIIAANDLIKKIPDLERANTILAKNEKVEQAGQIDPVAQTTQYAQNASFVSEELNNNENYIFYNVPADEFKKTKVGGFLKKVKRIVERSNPITRLLSGDDKQVASK